MVDGIFDKTLWALENVLDYRLKNQNIIAAISLMQTHQGIKQRNFV
jgi:hypothetical protein